MATYRFRLGKWQAQVRKAGSAPVTKTFTTKALAEAWAMAQEVSIERGEAGVVRDQITVRQLYEKYLEEVVAHRKGGRSDSLRVNAFLIYGPKALTSAKVNNPNIPELFRKWRDARLKLVQPSSVVREFNTLSAGFTHALREGWIQLPANPLSLVSRPDGNKSRKQRCTDEELIKIVGPIPDVAPVESIDYLPWIAHLAIETGMRQGEICQLRWSDIDVDRRVIKLVDEWTPDDPDAPSIKNGDGRDVPMSKKVIDIINQLSDYDTEDSEKIFPVQAGLISKLWQLAANKAGLDIQFRDLRREALTRLAKKVPFEILAKISGHRDTRVLLNVYYQPNMSSVASMLD